MNKSEIIALEDVIKLACLHYDALVIAFPAWPERDKYQFAIDRSKRVLEEAKDNYGGNNAT